MMKRKIWMISLFVLFVKTLANGTFIGKRSARELPNRIEQFH